MHLILPLPQVRKLRNDYGLIKQKPQLFLSTTDADKAAILASLARQIGTLSQSSEVRVLAAGESAPPGCSVAIVDECTQAHMLLKGILDPAMEMSKLEKKVCC